MAFEESISEEDMEMLMRAASATSRLPKKGILFKDITPLLKNPAVFRRCVNALLKMTSGVEFDFHRRDRVQGLHTGERDGLRDLQGASFP